MFTTSFGLEDQVITHLLCEQNLDVERRSRSIPAGCSPRPTTLWAETERRYGRRIRAFYPNRRASSAGREAGHQRLLRIREARGSRAAMSARSSRSIARSPARKAGSPACAPTSRPTAGHGAGQGRPGAGCSSSARCSTGRATQLLACVSTQRRADQSAARPGLRVDRLRALHARDRAGRSRARRPLVVGGRRQEGMRTALEQGVVAHTRALPRLTGLTRSS